MYAHIVISPIYGRNVAVPIHVNVGPSLIHSGACEGMRGNTEDVASAPCVPQ